LKERVRIVPSQKLQTGKTASWTPKQRKEKLENILTQKTKQKKKTTKQNKGKKTGLEKKSLRDFEISGVPLFWRDPVSLLTTSVVGCLKESCGTR